MTWNPKDFSASPADTRSPVPFAVTQPLAPAALPSHDVLDQALFALPEDAPLPQWLERECAAMGIATAKAWSTWRRLATRGIASIDLG